MTIDLDVILGLMVFGSAYFFTVCAVGWLVIRRVLIHRAAERAYRIRLARWSAESKIG